MGYDLKNQSSTDEELVEAATAGPPDPDLQALYGNAFVQEQLSSDDVEFCTRVADLPYNDTLGLEHWWLRTPNREGGMGADGAGVPGHGGGADSPYVTDTEIVDHAGQGALPESTCVPLSEAGYPPVDPACVDQMLEPGRDTGTWALYNQCHTVVEDILAHCRDYGENPADYTDPDPEYRYTGGQSGAGGAPQ